MAVFWQRFPGGFVHFTKQNITKTKILQTKVNYPSYHFLGGHFFLRWFSVFSSSPLSFTGFCDDLDVVFPVFFFSSLSDFVLSRLTSSSPFYSFCCRIGKFPSEIFPRSSCSFVFPLLCPDSHSVFLLCLSRCLVPGGPLYGLALVLPIHRVVSWRHFLLLVLGHWLVGLLHPSHSMGRRIPHFPHILFSVALLSSHNSQSSRRSWPVSDE